MDNKQISALSTPTLTEPAPPPSYDDSLQTSWQGTGTSSSGRHQPSTLARQPLDPAQYSLYTTTVPENAEQPTYDERLVAGIETKVSLRGNIITHSPVLQDPAALEAFVKQQASIPPNLKITCRGTHLHQRHTQSFTRSDNDLAAGKNRSHNEMVVDFDFQIELSSILESTVDLRTLTTIRPDRAVPRGTHHSTFHPGYQPYGPHYRPGRFLSAIDRWSRKDSDSPSEDRKTLATKPGIRPVRQERNLMKDYIRKRHAQGLPPWAPWPENLVQAVEGVRDQIRGYSEATHDRATRRRTGHGETESMEYSRIAQVEEGQVAEAALLEHATLRDWCQEFCASKQPLKEFYFYKLPYGWEWDSLHIDMGRGSALDNAPESFRVVILYEMKGYKEGRFMKRWEGRIKDAVMRRVGANGRPEVLGDALLAERQDTAGRQVTRALDGYESS
ncbi:hypothetical protein QFC21_001366 [Naganishia friedmannii]|uniref:Uncharacterized protein n=1 Tax=Naganishia friedmannii TaxID=89922 RepID=A0ACC2W3N0_9TREE|nr:hypothetical protein QFC21_001366 [Naganishia friedmannii]